MTNSKTTMYGQGSNWCSRLLAVFIAFILYTIIMKYGLTFGDYAKTISRSPLQVKTDTHVYFTAAVFVSVSISWLLWVWYAPETSIYGIDAVYTIILVLLTLWGALYFGACQITPAAVMIIILIIFVYYLAYKCWNEMYGDYTNNSERTSFYPKYIKFIIFLLLVVFASYVTYFMLVNLTASKILNKRSKRALGG